MRQVFRAFWAWYERHYLLNVSIAAGLFLLQLIHLYWLTSDVVATRLVGRSFFELFGIWRLLIVLVDYTEIPALISTSLVYVNEFRKSKSLRPILYLIFLNSQLIHIFWITDEFIVDQFTEAHTSTLPHWLAWVAIGIDYLELPVIFDVIKKLIVGIRGRRLEVIAQALEEK